MDIKPEESKYEWFEAAKSYEKELNSKPRPSLLTAEYWQKIGFCFNMASRQVGDIETFQKLRCSAVEAYQKAGKLFENENQAKSLEFHAFAEYAQSWVGTAASEKRKTLERCLELGKDAYKISKSLGDDDSIGASCILLMLCVWDLYHIIPTSKAKRNILHEALSYARVAIDVFSKVQKKDELVFSLSMSSLLSELLLDDHQEEKSLGRLCLEHAEEACMLSNDIDNPYSKAMAYWAKATSTIYFEEKLEERGSLFYPREMLCQASKVGDNYLKGNAYHLLAYAIFADVLEEKNPSTKKQRCKEIIKYSKKAIENLQLVNQDASIAVTHLFSSEACIFLAREFSVAQTEKIGFLKKAIKTSEKGLEYATRSGSPYALQVNLHSLSRSCFYYSILESNIEKRKEILDKALKYRKQEIASTKKSFQSNFWYTGVGMVYAAQIEAERARLEEDEKRKSILFEEAVAFMRDGILRCKRTLDLTEVPAVIIRIAESEDTFGGMLEDCFSLTKNPNKLIEANKIYIDAAKQFTKIKLPSRTAECYWKIARNHDYLRDYEEASSNFEAAQTEYELASREIPAFKDFYLDYANYVKAWSEIEKAKFAHCNDKYAVAKKHYEIAATLLKLSKPWIYLSANFQAWSFLEHAEDMSRKGNGQESIKSFVEAIKSFEESKQILSVHVEKIEKVDEKELTKRLIEVSDTRKEYSYGRISVEEAKILDKKGDHIASSEKYSKAAAIFEQLLKAKSEHIGNEVKPLFFLCKALEKMTLAEARVSPEIYGEAAELFRLANENSLTESASLLALAHSSFCRALQAGTEFEITRSETTYAEAKKHMNAAADYYLKAGFDAFSEYAMATQLLFDAYIYTDKAKKETEPEKEAKYYLIAEKLLQKSLESYAKAEYIEKANQVSRLLSKVTLEKELALSLSEVMHAPIITASTAGFTTLSSTEEKPVGLERFKHADIQAKLITDESEIKLGNYMGMEIQIVNVGKEPVLLTKIENILPTGFQLVGKPDFSSIHNSSLLFEGKQLSPLKTDKTKIILRPFKKGSFEIRPRISCIDEAGCVMVFPIEPLTFEVLPTFLQGRVETGFSALDDALLGGIPEKYSIVLSSPSNDTREKLIHDYLRIGAESGNITFYITADVGRTKRLVEAFSSNFYIFICNPRADIMIDDAPNVFKLCTIENLTEIYISLIKAFRNIDPSKPGSKRICIEILSDVLLHHHAVVTRKWLSQLLPELRLRGFTTLAVINPQMHQPEDVQAIVGQFEGEIQIYEREEKERIQQFIRVRKLYNQTYLENEIPITNIES